MENALAALSRQLAEAVERVGRSVVAVNGRPRLASSGVCWRPGVVVTADHTVRRDDEIELVLPGGRTKQGRLAGRDSGADLAVIRVETDALEPARIDSAAIRPGELALIVGRSPDSGPTASYGAIGAVAGPWRTWRGATLDRFVRLDATLYPGSSGGAAATAEGRVIGVATSGLSRVAPIAVPAPTVDRVVDELLARGYVSRAYLGVGLHPVSIPASLLRRLGLEQDSGVIVLSLEPGGPAEHAGVLPGDILIGLGARTVRDTDEVQIALANDAPGQIVEARLVRGGAFLELAIALGERPRREG